MKHYKQLTLSQRYQISALLETGITITQIAIIIGVNKSTVSRELKRNTPSRGSTAGSYIPEHAQQKAINRHCLKPKPIILTD
ncbi:helix-turn-helix domain-containing protein, partial [Psychroserpens burtonensis]